MTSKINSSIPEPTTEEFVVVRTFTAPIELIWKSFTEAERLAQWWGPKGFPITVHKLELNPGGTFHYNMKAHDGKNWWGKLVYQEIIAPEKLIFITSFSDEKCGITRHPLSSTWPLEVLNTLTLSEQAGKTTLTLRGGPINATEEERKTYLSSFASMEQGFKGTLDQLEEYLSTIVKGKVI